MKKKQTTPSSKTKSKLNPKQELFVLEYLKDFNAKQAAIRAGYVPSAGNHRGCLLLDRDDVQQRIEEKFIQITKKVQVDVEFVLRELLQIANCDILEAYDDDQCLKRLQDMPVQVRKAISSIKCDEIWEVEYEGKKKIRTQVGITKEVKFWDKKGSLELLGKYLAMFVERQRQEGADGQPLPAVQIHIHKHNGPQSIEPAARSEVVAAGNAT